MSEKKLSHIDDEGKAQMVDVGKKPVTGRVAVAEGRVEMRAETLRLIREGQIKKGDVLTVAQVAGIQAAKKTSELIPMCHPLPLSHVALEFELDEEIPGVVITAEVRTQAQTGVEMEALTAVANAALTIYDMAKSAEKTMEISGIRLLKKTGGQSGDVYNV